jgi:fructan beta-fructosidase
MGLIKSFFVALLLLPFVASKAQGQAADDPYRPQIHFTPPEHWMNDPNGLVYYKGTYHLFYQYFPGGTVWGPMHWGHATSTDLIHWKHQPIALYPDSLGYIFSGSAVVDSKNTSGLGKNGIVPLVAIFTHHDPKGEKDGKANFQNQSLAFSLDEGKTWTKYAHNPVLKNPGIKDFRDPKVSWNEVANKWIMTLAVLDHINFYSSPDLKNWTKESEFGKDLGAHGGVWECPDLFSLDWQGKKVWVLIVNLNPGGPNEGSATQYFVGKFDGRQFIPFDKQTRWLDYGPDEYAGVTYSNAGNRKIFLGWMSNWLYGQQVPTEKWRSAMTIPRELSLRKSSKGYLVASKPITELSNLAQNEFKLHNVAANHLNLTSKAGKLKAPAQLKMAGDKIEDFSITLSNSLGQKLTIGFDKTGNKYFIDRRYSGKVDFAKGFAARHTAPRLAAETKFDFTLVIDDASVELFADNGLTVMTEIFFPDENFSDIVIESTKNLQIKDLQLTTLRSIYK